MIRLLLSAVMLLTAPPAMAEGRYSADRYDSRIEVLDGGTMRVTETIALRFESGTFQQFYRAIPLRMTDGIEIVSASMDGEAFPKGDGPGHIQVSGSSSVRVTWHFAPTSGATHTFELTYDARGVARQEEDADVVVWTTLPTEHRYRIASSTTLINLPVPPSTRPALRTQRVGDSTVDADGGRVRIEGREIRGNGWLQAIIRLPRGSMIDSPPAWQGHQQEVNALSSIWISAALIVIVLGIALLFFVRQRYDSPARDFTATERWEMPPDTLSPAIAGSLLANGTPRLEQAMAAMFALADRGELRIDEQSRVLGQRQFGIARVRTGRPLAPYEQQLLDIVFGAANENGPVSLGKARNRLMRRFRLFRAALEPEMQTAGLLDTDRRAVRLRFGWIARTCLIAAGLGSIVASIFVARFGPWPMLIPLALAIVGVTALISMAAHTPLSNEGVRRARDWRGFRQHLRDIARDREPSPGDAVIRQMLPFAIALGLAQSWSSYLKRHRSAAPEWFRAVSAAGNNSAVAFSAFVAHGGTASGGHGAGAAAGGGSSGAS